MHDVARNAAGLRAQKSHNTVLHQVLGNAHAEHAEGAQAFTSGAEYFCGSDRSDGTGFGEVRGGEGLTVLWVGFRGLEII